MMKRLLLILIIFCGLQIKAQSIDARLVELNFAGSSNPKDVTKGENKIFFSADDGVHGRELWIHDLITNNTYSLGIEIGDSPNFTAVGDILYFTSWTTLWKSDGTEAGTYSIKNIAPNSFSNIHISQLKYVNHKLYFVANDTTHGYELWVSDDTEEGTGLLKDINPGLADSYISNMTILNNNLYFSADDGIHGMELWKSDGTAEGTILFKDIGPSSVWIGSLSQIIVMNNNFYFLADDGIRGNELWKSDGTPEGTALLKEFAQGNNGVTDFNGVVNNDLLIFKVDGPNGNELWKTNGTPEGTSLLKHVNYTPNNFNISQITAFNNNVYFTIGNYWYGNQLWKTDGTIPGTEMITLSQSITGNKIDNLTAAEDFLIFSYQNAESDYKTPWISNGTTSGTSQLMNINLTHDSASELNFIPANGMVFFQGNISDKSGVELWKTGGNSGNTKIVKEISHVFFGVKESLKPANYASASLNNKLVFIGNNGSSGWEPFVSDGIQISMLKDINPGEYSFYGSNEEFPEDKIFTKAGNKLFFKGNNGTNGNEIFCTDGTSAGTRLVKDIAPGNSSSIGEYTYSMEHNGIFYFKANDQIHGNELWRSDGTEEGTYMLKDIYPGPESGIITTNLYTFGTKKYASLNGFLYFCAKDEQSSSIWRTDGTSEGTIKMITLTNSQSNQDVNATILAATDNKIYLVSNYTNSTYGLNTLWSSDGTQDGTVLLDTYNESTSIQFDKSCIFNNELYLGVFNTETGVSLIKSNGTPEGTIILKGGLQKPYFQYINPCGDYVYFSINDDNYGSGNGDELWRTDGTAEGTILIAADPETTSYAVREYTCHNDNLLYFEKWLTNQLWITNGNPSGTISAEINVVNSDNFADWEGITGILGFIDDKIYFSGITRIGGCELYTTGIDVLSLNNKPITQRATTEDQFIIHPNPTKGITTISSKDNSTIQKIKVYDFSGKELINKDINLTFASIDLSGLSKGIYIIKINGTTSVETKKIILN